MTAAAAAAVRQPSAAWSEFIASPGATVAAVAAIAGAALVALQFESGISASLAPEVRTGQVLLALLAAMAAFMLWSPSISGAPATSHDGLPAEIDLDRLHTLALGGRIHASSGETCFEPVPFGSGHAWVRTRR